MRATALLVVAACAPMIEMTGADACTVAVAERFGLTPAAVTVASGGAIVGGGADVEGYTLTSADRAFRCTIGGDGRVNDLAEVIDRR